MSFTCKKMFFIIITIFLGCVTASLIENIVFFNKIDVFLIISIVLTLFSLILLLWSKRIKFHINASYFLFSFASFIYFLGKGITNISNEVLNNVIAIFSFIIVFLIFDLIWLSIHYLFNVLKNKILLNVLLIVLSLTILSIFGLELYYSISLFSDIQIFNVILLTSIETMLLISLPIMSYNLVIKRLG